MKRELIVALCALSAAPAWSQTVPSNVGVADRSRAGYDPIGGRIGAFTLYPSLTTTVDYTDNLYATETGKVGEGEVVVRPAVQLVSNWARHNLAVSGYYQRSLHFQRGTEDTNQAQVRVAGGLDISRTSRLDATFSVARLSEPRTNINSTSAARSPVTLESIDGRVTYRKIFNRLSVTATAGQSQFDYNDVISFSGTLLDQSFRNGRLTDGGVTVAYEFAGGMSLIGRVQTDRLSYDVKTVGEGANIIPFDRDSTGMRVEGGVSLDVTRLLSGTLRAGYLWRNNDNILFQDASGVSFGADLLYNVTPLTSIRLVADRTIEPGGSPLTSGNLRAQGTLFVDHELLRWVILSASARYANLDPIGGDFQSSTEFEGAFGARYLINRRLQARAEYRYITRSEGIYQPFDVNSFVVQLQVSL